MASGKDSVLPSYFSYSLQPVAPVGQEVRFFNLAPGYHVAELAGLNLSIEDFQDPGSNKEMQLRASADGKGNNKENVFSVFGATALYLQQECERKRKSVHFVAQMSEKPGEIVARASNHHQALDVTDTHIEQNLTDFYNSERNKKDAQKSPIFRELSKDDDLMRDMQLFLQDELPNSHAFDRMMKKMQSYASAEIQVTFMFRPSIMTPLENCPSAGSTGSVLVLIAIVCPDSGVLEPPTLDAGIERMLAANRQTRKAETEARLNSASRGTAKPLNLAQQKAAERMKCHAQRCECPYEDIVEKVYTQILPMQTELTKKLLHPHTKAFLAGKPGEDPNPSMDKFLKRARTEAIMLPDYYYDTIEGDLVPVTDAEGDVVYRAQSLELEFCKQFDPLLAITAEVNKVNRVLRDPLNYLDPRHLDHLYNRSSADEPVGKFARDLRRVSAQVNLRKKPQDHNLELLDRVLKRLEDQGTQNETVKLQIQKVKDQRQHIMHKRSVIMATYEALHALVFTHPALYKYGLCIRLGNGMDGLIEKGASVFTWRAQTGLFNKPEAELALTRMTPDLVTKFDQYHQSRRDNVTKHNPVYDHEVNPAASTLHGSSLMCEQMKQLTEEHVPNFVEKTPEPALFKKSDFRNTTFKNWEKLEQARIFELQNHQVSGLREYDPHHIFQEIGSACNNLQFDVGLNHKTCTFIRAACEMFNDIGIFGNIEDEVDEADDPETVHDIRGYSALDGKPPTLKELQQMATLSELKEVAPGCTQQDRISQINKHMYIKQQAELNRIFKSLDATNSAQKQGQVRREPQISCTYDPSICGGHNAWQELIQELSSGLRMLSAQRMTSWTLTIGCTAMNLIYTNRDRVNALINGGAEVSKSFVLNVLAKMFGKFCKYKSGTSALGSINMSEAESHHCGIEYRDEANPDDRTIAPGGKGSSMMNAAGEREKSERTKGEQMYTIATSITGPDGHNRNGTHEQHRYVLQTTFGASNDDLNRMGQATLTRSMLFKGQACNTVLTPAAIMADKPQLNSAVDRYQSDLLDKGRHFIWTINVLIFYCTALVQAGILPGVDTQSTAWIQPPRDDILAANAEDQFTFRLQDKTIECAQIKCFTHIANEVFGKEYSPSSMKMMRAYGMRKFGPENLFDHRMKFKIASMMYTVWSDDVWATMMALQDSKTERERIVQEAIIKAFVMNKNAAGQFAKLFGPHPKDNVDIERDGFTVNLQYVKIPISCQSKEQKTIFHNIARQIVGFIPRKQEQFDEPTIAKILMGLMNDTECFVEHPAMLDAILPTVSIDGCSQTVMSLMSSEAQLRDFAKSASPEIRSMASRLSMPRFKLTADKLNEMGQRWMQNDFNVLSHKPGSEFFPSAYKSQKDDVCADSLLSCDCEIVKSYLFKLDKVDKDYIEVNTWWLFRGMVRMQAENQVENLPDQLMDGMAHCSVQPGFYVHPGIGMEDVNRHAPHMFKCRYIKPALPNTVQGVLNTNFVPLELHNRVKRSKNSRPAEMAEHSHTLKPYYPESLIHCLRHNKNLADKFSEHVLSEATLLWADRRGIITAGPEFITNGIKEYIRRCLSDDEEYFEYKAEEVDTSADEPTLIDKMDRNLALEVMEHLFTTVPEDGGFAHFCDDYLMAADLELDEDEHGNVKAATRGRYYDNSPDSQTWRQGRAKQLSIDCMHMYFGPGEGMFCFQAIVKADRSAINEKINYYVTAFNNGGYHPDEQAPKGWDKTPYMKKLKPTQIYKLPLDIGFKSQKSEYTEEQAQCALQVRFWLEKFRETEKHEAQLIQSLSRELGQDLNKYGPTYYESRMKNTDRAGVFHHTKYVRELERLARGFHMERKERWDMKHIQKEYAQVTDNTCSPGNIKLVPDYVGSPEDEAFWNQFETITEEYLEKKKASMPQPPQSAVQRLMQQAAGNVPAPDPLTPLGSPDR